MDSIPIEYLGKIHSISAVKLLISFLLKAKDTNSLTVEYSITDMSNDLSCSKNTARAAISELVGIGAIVPVEKAVWHKPVGYKITLQEEREKDKMDGWSKATASSREEQQKNEILKQVREIDFNNIDFVKEDINSLMINNNVFMKLDEIKQLSHRVVLDYFYHRVIPPQEKQAKGKWIAMQKQCCTNLLVKYSTEQVCAGITYWVELKGLKRMNLRFLFNEKKMLEALGYYKKLYLETKSHDDARKRAEEGSKVRLEEKQRAEEEKQRIDNMSNEDFLKNLLGSIGKRDES